MKENKAKAVFFIRQGASPYCRTLQEGAKYLKGRLLPSELPHVSVWFEVLKIAEGGRP